MNLMRQIAAAVLLVALLVSPAAALVTGCPQCAPRKQPPVARHAMPCCPEPMAAMDAASDQVQPATAPMVCCSVQLGPHAPTFTPVAPIAVAPADAISASLTIAPVLVANVIEPRPHTSPPLAVLGSFLI